MSAAVMPIWRPQFLDANGAPLASGTVETYEAGTVTPLATYSDAALSVTNGTSLTLNSGGFPQKSNNEVGIFLLPRAYKFILKNSAGVTQRTLDNVYAVQAASAVNLEVTGTAGEALSANDCIYQSDGSGALTAGRWYKADADFVYASLTGVIGFATAAAALGASFTVRLGGTVDTLAGLVAGSSYFVSATAGSVTATAPTNARIVGVAASATTLVIDPHLSAAFLQRLLRINAASPYSLTLPAADAAGALVSDGAGTVSFSPLAQIVGGRLTATTGVPVTTADASGVTSIFFTPYKGNRIALYDGTRWVVRTFTEITISLGGLTASKPYDIFAFDNAGTVTIETLVWTNTTTRATALTMQDGVLVKTGATTRRYLGSVFINSSGGQTDDTVLKRYIWNYYNRVRKHLRAADSTDSWTYTTAAFHQANANAANQVEVMVGWDEVTLDLRVLAAVSNTNIGVAVAVGVGEDSTTAIPTEGIGQVALTMVAATIQPISAALVKMPAVGRHVYAWLEFSSAVGTSTWYGDNSNPSLMRSGLYGWCES